MTGCLGHNIGVSFTESYIMHSVNLQEFLDTVVLFSRGKTEDKLRIIFDMCDNDRNGVIDKGELSEVLRSLIEIARTASLPDEQVTELIEGMFLVSWENINNTACWSHRS